MYCIRRPTCTRIQAGGWICVLDVRKKLRTYVGGCVRAVCLTSSQPLFCSKLQRRPRGAPFFIVNSGLIMRPVLYQVQHTRCISIYSQIKVCLPYHRALNHNLTSLPAMLQQFDFKLGGQRVNAGMSKDTTGRVTTLLSELIQLCCSG